MKTMDAKFQKEVQKVLAKAGNCPTCRGLGVVNHPAGPVPVGAKLPKCSACDGTGKLKEPK